MLVCIYSYRPITGEPIFQRDEGSARQCDQRMEKNGEVYPFFWNQPNGERGVVKSTNLCPTHTQVQYYKDSVFRLQFNCICTANNGETKPFVCQECKEIDDLAKKPNCISNEKWTCKLYHDILEYSVARELFRPNEDIFPDGQVIDLPCVAPTS